MTMHPQQEPLPPPPKSVCKGCGRPVIWAITETGSTIPLDAIAPCYEVVEGQGGERRAVRTRARCSHFATCSKANQFSGKGRKETR